MKDDYWEADWLTRSVVCISYANGKQKIWDRWGQLVQPLAAQVPWMVSPGNHEMHYLGTPYLYRFAMPGTTSVLVAYPMAKRARSYPHCIRLRALPAAQSGGESGNMYYSFNYGNVHVIALDSEASSFSAQVEWVKKDLRRVDRAVTPWIIGFWHRPWYCSSTGTFLTYGQRRAQVAEEERCSYERVNIQCTRTRART